MFAAPCSARDPRSDNCSRSAAWSTLLRRFPVENLLTLCRLSGWSFKFLNVAHLSELSQESQRGTFQCLTADTLGRFEKKRPRNCLCSGCSSIHRVCADPWYSGRWVFSTSSTCVPATARWVNPLPPNLGCVPKTPLQ